MSFKEWAEKHKSEKGVRRSSFRTEIEAQKYADNINKYTWQTGESVLSINKEGSKWVVRTAKQNPKSSNMQWWYIPTKNDQIHIFGAGVLFEETTRENAILRAKDTIIPVSGDVYKWEECRHPTSKDLEGLNCQHVYPPSWAVIV